MNRRRWIWITVAACIAASTAVALGLWQLRRAEQKEILAAAIAESEAQAVLDGADVLPRASALPLLHRRVRLRGHWLADKTVYLDNRQMQAKVGFYVLTPLQIEGSGRVLMLQRGWIARDFVDRKRLPTIDTPSGTVDVLGRIALPPSKLYEFAGAQEGPIRQNIDLAQYRIETGLDLQTEYSIVQLGDASQGLLRDWPVINVGVEKHYGYAAQWFALAALVLGLYVWFQLLPLRTSSKDSSAHV